MMDPKMTMEVPTQIKEFAEKTLDQAEKGFNAFIEAANKSVGMMPGPATDMSKKVLAMTEQNLRATFDHSKKLLHAKDVQEAFHIQTEFLKAQYAAATEQLKEMGSSVRSSVEDVSKTEVPIR
jgi:phasin